MIESWARSDQGNSNLDLARQSGQLNDNVTEQRLFRTRLMDLSRARYRCESQFLFERRMFVERQAKKDSVFRALLHDMPLHRGASYNMWSGKRHPAASQKSSSVQKQPTVTDATEVVNDPEAENLPENGDVMFPPPSRDVLETKSDVVYLKDSNVKDRGLLKHRISRDVMSSKTVSIQLPKDQSDIADKHRDNRKLFRTDPTRMLNAHARQTKLQGDVPGDGKERPESLPQVVSALQRSNQDGGENQVVKNWARKYTHRKGQASGPMTDPRYQSLEQTLCKLHGVNGMPPDLNRVIKSNASLHEPSRKKKETRAAMSCEIRQFMLGRGLIVWFV